MDLFHLPDPLVKGQDPPPPSTLKKVGRHFAVGTQSDQQALSGLQA